MAQDSVKIQIDVATQAAEKALSSLKHTTEQANSTFNIFKGTFAAGLAIEGIKAAFSAMSGLVGSFIDESSKAEQSVKNMNVALQNAGLYSAKTSQDFQDFADELERTTAFSGDAAEGSIALFASLTTLSKDGLKQATQAAADLAATLNVDMATATDMIAKAVNGNVTAFGKLGIEIQKGNTDSENLTNTLKALSSQQGAAQKSADTYAGAMTKLDNQKGKLFESIGNLITQNPVFVKGIQSVTSTIESLSAFISDNSKDITLFAESMLYASGIVSAAGIALAGFGLIVGSTTGILGTLSVAASTAWAAITGPVGLVVGAIIGVGVAIYGVVKYWDDIKIATYETTAAMLDYASKAAGVFSKSGAESIKAQADAYRDKADAIRIAQVAEIEAQNAKKLEQENQSKSQDSSNEVARVKKEQEELVKVNAEKIAARRNYNSQLFLADQEFQIQLQEQQAAHEQVMFDLSGQYDSQKTANELAAQEQRLLARQQFELNSLNAQIEADKSKALLIEDSIKREQALRDAGYKADIERGKLQNKQQLELQAQKNKSQQQLESEAVRNRSNTLSLFASLQNSSNKELQAIGKASAITSLAIATPKAVGEAYAFGTSMGGPILGAVFGGIASAAMAAQMAQVVGVQFQDGGVVGGFVGATSGPDNVVATVRRGEMYLNAAQQRKLFDIANGEQSSSNNTTNALLAAILDAVKSGSTIEIDGREIVSVVRDSLTSGRSLA